jgi:hypothetical protein
MGSNIAIGVCCLIGSGMFLFAIKKVIETVHFIRASSRTVGTVISYASARNSDGGAMYLPVVEFTSPGGNTIRFTSTVASNPPTYKIGEQTDVLFLRRNPQAAKIKSFCEMWLVTFVLSVISFACLITAILIFLAR